MSDAANEEPSMRSDEPAVDTFATPEFHEALNAAEVLLGYAAGNGLMPANMPTIWASRCLPGTSRRANAIIYWPTIPLTR